MAKLDANWFRNKLTQKNRSQRALAKHLGLDPGAITLTFNGKRRLQMDEARKIATFLGEPLADVLRAAGLPLGDSPPTKRAYTGTPVEALRQKRAELVAEIETIDKVIELLEK
jgi:transcriptional regulator with XRE-family HTH domain